MATINSLRSKTLMFKISYLTAECNEVSHKCENIDQQIWKFIKENYPEEYKLAVNVIAPNANKDLDNHSQLKCQNKDVKKLYHKIVELSHPDKTEGKEDVFRDATEAYKDQQFGRLLELGAELNIEVGELSDDSIELLEQNTLDLEKKLEGLKNSTAWFWYNSETEEEKKELSKFILKQKGISV